MSQTRRHEISGDVFLRLRTRGLFRYNTKLFCNDFGSYGKSTEQNFKEWRPLGCYAVWLL
jgi:hypothetical protein